MSKKPTIKCPDCNGTILLEIDSQSGDVISCPSCGGEFELKFKNSQFILDELKIEQDDWGE